MKTKIRFNISFFPFYETMKATAIPNHFFNCFHQRAGCCKKHASAWIPPINEISFKCGDAISSKSVGGEKETTFPESSVMIVKF